ncbi:MAG: hypothetical protein ACREKS_10450, partial [Candidatus Rokuibacteriota bacterium]
GVGAATGPGVGLGHTLGVGAATGPGADLGHASGVGASTGPGADLGDAPGVGLDGLHGFPGFRLACWGRGAGLGGK